jgi:protein-S-isoprenylcysteine O-methyltransferase Ste14
MVQVGAFIILSVLLLAFTRSRPHRHRTYRFLAFESLLGLVLLQTDHWFQDPLSPLQLFSWFFLTSSLLLALHGFWLLRTAGSPAGDIENTTLLVTRGAYRCIRHPLYCSLLLLGIGALLKRPALFSALLFSSLAAFVFATGKVEEHDNLKRFGEAYREYMKGTKMFIPYLV